MHLALYNFIGISTRENNAKIAPMIMRVLEPKTCVMSLNLKVMSFYPIILLLKF
jgi:hypothetical protein